MNAKTNALAGAAASVHVQKRIGGGDVAAIVGVDKWRTSLDVWRKLVEGYQTPQTLPMRLGLALEPLVRSLYAEQSPSPLLGPIKLPGDARGAPWAVGSLDDRRADGVVVELKTASLRVAHEWGDGAEEVPDAYRLQCAWYLWLADAPCADLGVLIGGEEFRVYRLTRDLELENLAREAAERFWRNHVLTETPPAVDASDSSADWLKSRRRTPGRILVVTQPLLEAVEQWREAKATAGEAEEVERGKRNALLSLLGDAEGVEGLVSYRRTKDSEKTDWEAVARAVASPEQIAAHTHPKPGYPVLRYLPKGKP